MATQTRSSAAGAPPISPRFSNFASFKTFSLSSHAADSSKPFSFLRRRQSRKLQQNLTIQSESQPLPSPTALKCPHQLHHSASSNIPLSLRAASGRRAPAPPQLQLNMPNLKSVASMPRISPLQTPSDIPLASSHPHSAQLPYTYPSPLEDVPSSASSYTTTFSSLSSTSPRCATLNSKPLGTPSISSLASLPSPSASSYFSIPSPTVNPAPATSSGAFTVPATSSTQESAIRSPITLSFPVPPSNRISIPTSFVPAPSTVPLTPKTLTTRKSFINPPKIPNRTHSTRVVSSSAITSPHLPPKSPLISPTKTSFNITPRTPSTPDAKYTLTPKLTSTTPMKRLSFDFLAEGEYTNDIVHHFSTFPLHFGSLYMQAGPTLYLAPRTPA